MDAHGVTVEQPPRGAFQADVLAGLPALWDGRDVRHLHHPVWFRQLVGTAQAARLPDGSLCGYLLGCRTPEVAYVHAVAVLPQLRGTGLAERLYAHVLLEAARAGCTSVEAVTTPGNARSIAFHRRLGFAPALVPDYAGPGQDRVHLVLPVPGGT